MVGKVDYSSVPTSVDLENNSNQKKYTVNQPNKKGLVISKPLCALMAIGAFLLALLVGLLVFFLVPRYCNGEKHPEALTQTTHYNNNNNVDTNKADEKSVENKADDDVDERLPRSIEPSYYKIQILPDLVNFTISGSVTMTLSVLESTNEITFHLRNISVLDHSVIVKSTKPDSSPLEINIQEYLPGEKYKISLKDQLEKDKEYELYIDYNGQVGRHLKGFYGTNYTDNKGQEKVIASTQFSPTEARMAFPCFDEPSFKAKFTITIGRPSHMSTLSNMPLHDSIAFTNENTIEKRSIVKKNRSRRNSSNLWYWDKYPETPKMSTYLVAFIVHDFKSYESNETSLMKFWARDQYLPFNSYSSKIGPRILNFLENYFEIRFPLPKIDMIALPGLKFTAMENWGLITFKETALLYDPNSSSIAAKGQTAAVIAHELAHQWFGNLVTPKFWNDLWLKEGFANYMQYLALDEVEPTWKFSEEFIISETIRAMNNDAFETSRPLSFDEAKHSDQIRNLFDAISYSKGAAIIKMMKHFLGERTFKEGLIIFLKKYQHGNADRQNLFAALTEVAHQNNVLKADENVKTIMDSWAERAGYPVVTAVADYEQQKLTISQKRFYFNQKDEKSSWWVPLSFTTNATSNNPDFTDTLPKFWLKGEYEIENNVNFTDNDWYLLNLGHTGYFIVNYDERNWRKLSERIMDLPPAIRAQLIANSMDLAKANLLNYDIPLTMIANMAIQDGEIMFIPTQIALTKLDFLWDILSTTPAFGLFEEYQRNIFQDTYRKVTLEDQVEDYIARKIRMTVLKWSCKNPDSRCTHMAKTSFRDWIVRGKRVDPDVRATVYCTAIREGGEIEWDFAFKQYLQTKSISEKSTLMDALGCTRLKWLLSRYMDKLLTDPSITIEDAPLLFKAVASNKAGTQIAFDFLRKNWDEIIEHDGFETVSTMVKSLGDHLSNEFELSELIRFRDSITNIPMTAKAFEEAINSVKRRVEWMEKNYLQVEQWLQNNKDLRSRIREKLKMERYFNSQRPPRGS